MTDLSDKIRTLKNVLRTEYLTSASSQPWVVGFSGGKDSTLLAHFVVEMIKSVAPDERTRPIVFLSNDTRVESPIFQSFVDQQLEMLRENLAALRLPVTVVQTQPASEESFWVKLLGKGYPAPSPNFRWCTNNLKIKPTVRFLRDQVAEHGGATLLLGIRRAESSQRAKTIARHEAAAPDSAGWLTPHTDVQGCNVFAPIKEFTTEEVWALLLQLRPPWGGSYRTLIRLYRDAHAGECPFVASQNDQASCGSSSARFGCWTCTVVRKDRALDALAEQEDGDDLERLSAFRVRIKQVSDDPDHRSPVRRNGQAGWGPFKLESRRLLLDELLSLQTDLGHSLITDEEVNLIRHQWRLDEAMDLRRELNGRTPSSLIPV